MTDDYPYEYPESRDLPNPLGEYYDALHCDSVKPFDLAYQWKDKPHRLVFDLIAYARFLRKQIKDATDRERTRCIDIIENWLYTDSHSREDDERDGRELLGMAIDHIRKGSESEQKTHQQGTN